MYISNPHFFNADKEVLESVEGMMPDNEKHETYLDIDPVSRCYATHIFYKYPKFRI